MPKNSLNIYKNYLRAEVKAEYYDWLLKKSFKCLNLN